MPTPIEAKRPQPQPDPRGCPVCESKGKPVDIARIRPRDLCNSCSTYLHIMATHGPQVPPVR
ncbi:MAG: hypothetical protein GTO63_07945 [Anaerolineae bacterium]|nr:hypothetical protein [Anaerolineae bacterium]NIN94861.1 hypothetical protein [Anaerolineae bacterium]NIQ77912.1 hypothetical protein [Anaerolineae bacterium]